MAENKKKIIIYADWITKFEALEDDEAGRLIKHFFRYINDLNPKSPDRITELSFIDIQNTLKRDLKKWENKAEKSRENGKLGGRPPQNNNPEEPKETEQVILEPKEPVNVIVSDSVNGNVSVNDISFKKEIKYNFKKNLILYGFEEKLVNDWLLVRKTKKATNTETAFNGFVSEIEKRSCNINEILTKIIENNWKGFKWEWVDALKNNNSNGKQSNSEAIRQW